MDPSRCATLTFKLLLDIVKTNCRQNKYTESKITSMYGFLIHEVHLFDKVTNSVSQFVPVIYIRYVVFIWLIMVNVNVFLKCFMKVEELGEIVFLFLII